jgi:hypothetical protein
MSHQAHRDVASVEGLTELSTHRLVAVLKSGSEVSPLSTHRATKLLGRVQSLLELGIVQQLKLGLDDAKLDICLKWISRLGERRRVRHQEVIAGGVHHRLVMQLAHSTVDEVLHQHPHELVLRGCWHS